MNPEDEVEEIFTLAELKQMISRTFSLRRVYRWRPLCKTGRRSKVMVRDDTMPNLTRWYIARYRAAVARMEVAR